MWPVAWVCIAGLALNCVAELVYPHRWWNSVAGLVFLVPVLFIIDAYGRDP
jgi:hypothetical protein